VTIDVRGMTPLIRVFDMPTSLKFYCDVLGFEIVQADSHTTAPNHNWVWLKQGEINLMLNTAYEYDKRPPSPDPRRVASHGDNGSFIGAPDVDAVSSQRFRFRPTGEAAPVAALFPLSVSRFSRFRSALNSAAD
jgi:catechol 2,3-dioxygenase-like lactoylglutathione lyase family enzyme